MPDAASTCARRFLALLPLTLAAALGLVSPGRAGQPSYSVADLGTLPGGRGTEPRAINARGDVVGVTATRGGPPVAFRYRDGVLSQLAAPGSEAWDVNDRGEVVGCVRSTNGAGRAVLWRPDADPVDLGAGIARAINARGQIAGSLGGGSLWTPSSPGPPPGTTARPDPFGLEGKPAHGPEAVGLNDRGQVIGSVRGLTTEVYPVRGFVWEAGRAADLRNLGAPHCHPLAINESGQIVGMSSYAAVPRGIAPLYLFHAFLWEAGNLRDLGALGDGRTSAALGLNDRGQVVGWSETRADEGRATGRDRVAFLYREGRMTDLNRQIPPDSGWELREARAINDRGQIVGVGVKGGEERGFLLTPRGEAGREAIPRDFQITAESGPGGLVYGASAAGRWETTIGRDGTLRWVSGRGDRERGEGHGPASLSEADLEGLLAAVRAADFFSLGTRYQQSFHEGPLLRLVVTASGKTHQVVVASPHLKREHPEVKRFLAVWSEVVGKIQPPMPDPAVPRR